MTVNKNSSQILPTDLYDLTAEDKKRIAEEQALGMISPQAKILNQVAQAVNPRKIVTPKVQHVVTRLLEVAGTQQVTVKSDKRRRMLVGLAAPQIGESVRVIIADTAITPERKKPGKLECFINPEIIWRSRETEEAREGCFSTGPVWGLVRRPVAVKIKAFTPEGNKIEQIFEGFTARIVQHEIDHLDGIRFPDRIKSDKKRHWVHAEELSSYPRLINRWHRHCTLNRWQLFQGGRTR